MSELILLCCPEEVDESRRFGLRIACAAWRVGNDGRLWRCPLPELPRGSIMAVFGGADSGLPAADISAECARLNIDEVLCFNASSLLSGLKKYKLYAPISTAISGGSLAQRFAGEKNAFIEPCREYFSLPSHSGSGTPISAGQLKNFIAIARCTGFSAELGCKYAFSAEGCVLYDDLETVRRKTEILGELGVERIVLPYASPSVRAFLRSRP